MRTDMKKDKRDRSDKPAKTYYRRKVCKFCADKTVYIDYKDVGLLRNYVTDRGKIIPRRISGACAGHQRELTVAIKQSRNIALLPFTEK
ncbi:MAG: 30S ribosomal protein S18 [Nitrospirae bacterium]|nr:30S ribosomal protein S18 [Nitrospirota bacterium]